MKSCLGVLMILGVFLLVVGGGALIFYLSDTAEFTRKDGTAAESGQPLKAIPRAEPVPEPKRR